jgi:U1 small nuclear ribonucleoprotein
VERRSERKDRRKKERAEQVAYKLEQEIALWDPNAVIENTGDPFKTLFIARVNFYTRFVFLQSIFLQVRFFSESKLKREFEQYGAVASIRMVMSTKDTKPRGYAFIEYEHEKDMHCEYSFFFKTRFHFKI